MARKITAGTFWVCKGTDELYFISSTREAETDRFEVYVQFTHMASGGRWSNPVEVGNSEDITKQEFEALCQGQEFVEVEAECRITKNPK